MITHHEIDETTSLMTVLDIIIIMTTFNILSSLKTLQEMLTKHASKGSSYEREVFKATKTNSQDEAPSASTVSAFSSYLGIIMSPPVEDQHW